MGDFIDQHPFLTLAWLTAGLATSGGAAVLVCFAASVVRAVRRRSDEARTAVHSVPANDRRLPAGIDAHLDDYAALDPHLAPVFAPDLDRLWQAVHDEQQKGEQ